MGGRQAMNERLSTRWTPVLRWASSVLTTALCVSVLILAFQKRMSVGQAIFATAFAAICNWRAWLWQLHLWDVWLLPGGIRVARGRRSEEIPLSEVESVAYRKVFGFAEILLQPKLEGRRIIFFVPRGMSFILSLERPEAVDTLAEGIANRGRGNPRRSN